MVALSTAKQCGLAGISRSGLYYEPAPESALNEELMRLIDEQYMVDPKIRTGGRGIKFGSARNGIDGKETDQEA